MEEAVTTRSEEDTRAGRPPAARPLAPPHDRSAGRERLRGAVPVALVVLIAGLWMSYYERLVTGWIVMTDELLYAKLGVAVGSSLSPVPQIHGEYYPAFSQLYPILTGPVYRLLDMPTAFEVVHILNAFLMASTAIPVYLLTRELLSQKRWPAVLAAALAVCVPWVTMGLMILTEPAAYPAFAWALLAIQRSIARGAVRTDALALCAILVAFLARTQFILLAIVLPLAIVVHEVGYALIANREARRRNLRAASRRILREHRLLLLVYGLGAATLVPILLTGTAGRLLGAYAVTTEGALLPPGIWASLAGHLDYVIVGLGVLPFIAAVAWCLSQFVRPGSRAHHAFAVLVGLLLPALALQVASFSVRFAQGFQDRYLFYVAPLILVAFVVSLADRRRRRVDLLIAGLFGAWLLSFGQYAAAGGPYFGSPASAFHQVLDGRSQELGELVGISDLQPRTVVLLVSVVGAVAMAAGQRWLRPGRMLAVTGAAVLAFLVLETSYTFDKMLYQNGRTVTGGTTEGRDWVDQRVGNAEVALIPSHINTAPDAYFVQGLWWDTEFWNKSVSDAYSYDGATTFTPFPFDPLGLDYRSGEITGATGAEYVILSATNVRLRPASLGTSSSPDGHLTLLRTPERMTAEWATRGILDDGWIEGRSASIRLYGTGTQPQSRRVAVTVTSSPEVLEPRRYTLDSGDDRRSATLDTAEAGSDHIDVCVPRSGHADVDIRVDGTTTLSDGREGGLRLTSIRSIPSAAGLC